MVAIIAFHVQIQKVFFIPFRYNSHLHFFLNLGITKCKIVWGLGGKDKKNFQINSFLVPKFSDFVYFLILGDVNVKYISFASFTFLKLKKLGGVGSWELTIDSWGQLFIPSFFHFFEYRLLTPGRSGNSFNSKEVEHLRNLNYVNTLYSIIR